MSPKNTWTLEWWIWGWGCQLTWPVIGDGWGFPRGFATGKAPKWDASDQQKYWTTFFPWHSITICISYISYLILEFGISVFICARSPQSTELFHVLHSFSMPTIWFDYGVQEEGTAAGARRFTDRNSLGNSVAKCWDFCLGGCEDKWIGELRVFAMSRFSQAVPTGDLCRIAWKSR